MLVSVITIVKHEVAHLRNLIRGVDAQTRPVDELVIVALGRVGVQAEAELASSPVTILHDPPAGYRPGATSHARAEGAGIAVGDLLVFLDADVIPCRHLVERYVGAAASGALLLGPVVHPSEPRFESPEAPTPAGVVSAGNMAVEGAVWSRLVEEAEDVTGPCTVPVQCVDEAVAYRQRSRRPHPHAWWDEAAEIELARRATSPMPGRRTR